LRALVPVASPGLERLIADMKPSARLLRRGSDRNVVGESRFGGIPDLPGGVKWPSYVRRVEDPRSGQVSRASAALDFVGQLRLADVPPGVLPPECPTSGLLSFFYDRVEQPWGFDPADRGGGQVLYHPESVNVLPTLPPPELRARATRACAVQLAAEWTLLDPDMVPEREPAHDDVIDRWDEVMQVMSRWPDQPEHRLFGHSQNIQNEMTLECQLVSSGLYCGDGDPEENPLFARLAGGAKDWILLLQLDTDDEGLGWIWGDCGRIYFWIRRQDLSAGRFDATWTILQCT
jgi:uncharacterized protein YwqG